MNFKSFACVSDLHLSDKSKGDDFYNNNGEQKLNVLMDWLLKEKISRIFVLGDFVDCMENDGNIIQEKYKELLDRLFAKFSVFYINGNHDTINRSIYSLMPYLGLYSNKELYLCGNKLLFDEIFGNLTDEPIAKFFPMIFIHGHAFDDVISKNPKLAEIVAMAGGWFERHGFPQIDKKFSDFEKWLSNSGRHDKNGGMDKEFSNWAIENKYKLAIAGHTHGSKLEIQISKNGKYSFIYGNTGSWTNKDRPCSAIIIREENIDMIESSGKEIKISKTINLGG